MERRGPTTLSGSWTRTNTIGTVSPVLPRRQKMACDLLKEIYLTSNNLRGLVPADLALLSTLHHLDMDEGDNVWTHDGLGLFGFLQPPGEWNDTH